MYARVTELRIKQDCVAAFVEATRVYHKFTRVEPGNIRAELLLSVERPPIFVIHEAYRDEASFWQHANALHTSRWNDEVAEHFQEQPSVRHLTGVGRYATPPKPARRPVLESAATWTATDTRATGVRAVHLPRLRVTAQTIEVGNAIESNWIGGEADPCLLVGAYVVHEEQMRNVGRAVYRFRPQLKAPCELIRDDKLLDAPVFHERGPLEIVLLMFAVEENSGSDVRALFQDLGEPEALNLWRRDAQEPRPLGLAELALSSDFKPNVAERVHVLHHGSQLSDRLSSDGWVGAAVARFVLDGLGKSAVARFHTASEDRRNDWLTVVQMSVEKSSEIG